MESITESLTGPETLQIGFDMEKHTVGLMYRLLYSALNSEANFQGLAHSLEQAHSQRMTDALEQVGYFVAA